MYCLYLFGPLLLKHRKKKRERKKEKSEGERREVKRSKKASKKSRRERKEGRKKEIKKGKKKERKRERKICTDKDFGTHSHHIHYCSRKRKEHERDPTYSSSLFSSPPTLSSPPSLPHLPRSLLPSIRLLWRKESNSRGVNLEKKTHTHARASAYSQTHIHAEDILANSFSLCTFSVQLSFYISETQACTHVP